MNFISRLSSKRRGRVPIVYGGKDVYARRLGCKGAKGFIDVLIYNSIAIQHFAQLIITSGNSICGTANSFICVYLRLSVDAIASYLRGKYKPLYFYFLISF